MSLRNIIIEPDPILREKSLPVEKVDSDLQKLLNEMLETMYAAPGIGLAAVQIGISIYEEGCLSIPGHFAEIERPATCHLDYVDYNGKKKAFKAEGLLATCIQHEVDHLNGVLFIDYLSKLKKDMIIKKLIKQKKELDKVIL